MGEGLARRVEFSLGNLRIIPTILMKVVRIKNGGIHRGVVPVLEAGRGWDVHGRKMEGKKEITSKVKTEGRFSMRWLSGGILAEI